MKAILERKLAERTPMPMEKVTDLDLLKMKRTMELSFIILEHFPPQNSDLESVCFDAIRIGNKRFKVTQKYSEVHDEPVGQQPQQHD